MLEGCCNWKRGKKEKRKKEEDFIFVSDIGYGKGGRDAAP